MTISELNNYYLLEGAIKDTKEKIITLKAQLCASPAFNTSGIPRNPTPRNHTEETFIELAHLKTELEKKARDYETLKIHIEQYIADIPDLLIHRIMTKKVIENKRWKVIAEELGGGNTKDSVKKMYYRYIADNPD